MGRQALLLEIAAASLVLGAAPAAHAANTHSEQFNQNGTAADQAITPSGWTDRPPVTYARAGADVATVGGRILLIGGFHPSIKDAFDYVEARSVSGPGTWSTLAPLPTPRANAAVAELGGLVYVAGGFGRVATDVVEKFDPRTGSWTQSAKLPERRGGASAASLGGLLYVVGGYLGGNFTVSASALAFDPIAGSWKSVAPMPTARAQLRLVAAEGYLYAIGGVSADDHSLSTVERYNPASNSWQAVASMNRERYLPGVVATSIGSKPVLVAVGGLAGDEWGRSTEVYNLKTGQWRVIDAQLPSGRASVPAAVEADGTVLLISGGSDITGSPAPTTSVLALKLTNRDLG